MREFKMVVENSGKALSKIPKSNDASYIKNLQHQIYLLELELDGGKPQVKADLIVNPASAKTAESSEDKLLLNQTIEFLETKVKSITAQHAAKSTVWIQEKQQMVGDLLKLKQTSESGRKEFEKQINMLKQQEKVSNNFSHEITTLNALVETMKETSMHQEVLIKAQQEKLSAMHASSYVVGKAEEESDTQLIARLKMQVISLGSKLEQTEASKRHEVFLREHVVSDLNEALAKITQQQALLIESSDNQLKAAQLSALLAKALQEVATLKIKATVDLDLLSEKTLLLAEKDKSIASQFKKLADLEATQMQNKVMHDSTIQQNTELESELLASNSAASLLELEKRMLIDEIAELQNEMDAAKRELDMSAMDKRVEAVKHGKMEEKCRVLMGVIGRMDELQKSSQAQEKILSEMRSQLVSL